MAAWPAVLLMLAFGLSAALGEVVQTRLRPTPLKALAAAVGTLCLAGALSALVIPAIWPLAAGLGGLWGDALLWAPTSLLAFAGLPLAAAVSGVLLGLAAVVLLAWTLGLRWRDLTEARPARPCRVKTAGIASSHGISTIFPWWPSCITASWERGASASENSRATTGRSVPLRSPATRPAWTPASSSGVPL